MNLREIASGQLSDVRQRDTVCVEASTPLISVVEQMNEHRRGAVAVVDADGVLIGIFSIRDLVRRVDHKNHDWHSQAVGESMTRNPICVSQHDTMAVALRLMEEGTFRHLPRVDEAGRPTAIFSVRDVLTFVSEHFPKEFMNLPPDPEHQATKPWGG